MCNLSKTFAVFGASYTPTALENLRHSTVAGGQWSATLERHTVDDFCKGPWDLFHLVCFVAVVSLLLFCVPVFLSLG